MIDTISINGTSKLIREYSTDASAITGNKIKLNTRKGFNGNSGVLVSDGESISYPCRESIPQTGTWQLKESARSKKYIMLGTDDDRAGNSKIFRLLRTYNLPYKMNVCAENIDANVYSDIDTSVFTDDDAPSLFPNYVTKVRELAYYMRSHPSTGEVALHGYDPLWDSAKLTGSAWNTLYSTYTSAGGTKTETELKDALKTAKASTDISQGATYVATNRQTIEAAYNMYVNAVGIWGGDVIAEIDGISLNLASFRSGAYPWRANNYCFASLNLNNGAGDNTPWNANRYSIKATMLDEIDSMANGSVRDYYTHWFGDMTATQWRTVLSGIKERVDEGGLVVLTPSQYYKLGEFV